MRRRFELFQLVPPSSRMLVGKVWAYSDFYGRSGAVLDCHVEGNTIHLVYRPTRYVARWINKLKIGMPFRWEGYGGVLDGVLENIETFWLEPDLAESVLTIKLRGGKSRGGRTHENSKRTGENDCGEKQDVRKFVL